MTSAPAAAPPLTARLPASDRVHGLDGIRGFALLAVLLFHVTPAGAPGGFAGVDVFFVLSGFLITTVLLREQRRDGRIDLRGFYIRRARRLLPAAVVVVTVVAASALLIGGDLLVGLAPSVLGIFTLTQNWVMIGASTDYFAHTGTGLFDNFWSLAIEEQFYLVWPVLLLALCRMDRRTGLRILGGTAVVATIVPLLLSSAGHASLAYLSTFGHVFGLVIGALLAVLLQHPPRPLGGGDLGPLTATLLLLIGLPCLALVVFSPLAADPGHRALTTVLGALVGAMIVTGCVRGVPVVTRLLDGGPLGWLGRRSYGIYLWHLPLIVLADALVRPVPGVGALPGRLLAVVLALVVASLSLRFVERPFLTSGFLTVWRTSVGRAASMIFVVVLVALTLTISHVAPVRTSLAESLAQLGTEATAPPEADGAPEPTSPGTTAPPGAGGATEPPSSEGPVLQQPVLAIGDSVMLASREVLGTVFPGATVDAAVGRQLSDGAALVTEGLKNAPDTEVVVVGLGINGLGGADDLRRIVDAAGDRTVVLLTQAAPVAWEGSVNQAIEQVASEYPNVVVAGWHERVTAHPEYLASDGTHPGPSGAKEYADCIASALGTATR